MLRLLLVVAGAAVCVPVLATHASATSTVGDVQVTLEPAGSAQEPLGSAQADPERDGGTELRPDDPVGDIIPRPNTGRAPEDPGDRGGWLQLGLLALILAVVALGGLHLWRQSAKARGGRRVP